MHIIALRVQNYRIFAVLIRQGGIRILLHSSDKNKKNNN